MALITVRAVNPATWEPICGQGLAAFLSDRLAVAQIIATTLKLWGGEWWEDTSKGVPYFGSGLGHPGLQQQQSVFTLALQTAILAVPYVNSIADVLTTFGHPNRAYTFTCTANTAFGPVPVVYPVGAVYQGSTL
jgi:hypothetical protein